MLSKKIALCLVIALALSGCASNTGNKDSKSNKPKANATSARTKGNGNQEKPGNSGQTGQNTESESSFKPFNPITVSDPSSLPSKKNSWSWAYSPRDSASLLTKYHGYAFGDTSKKVIYLTFDEGYENGYTSSILDTLKANNVKATFFVTLPYVTGSFNGVKDSDLIKRMVSEGHIVGDHSVHHYTKMSEMKDEAAFDSEITGVEQAVNSIPGAKMSKFFRPPEGAFSELSLYYTQKLGFRSIFFALAHNDYDPKNQPDPETAKKNLLNQTKPGMICLLHALSKTNASILDSLIKQWKSEGYQFGTLNDLP